MIVTGNTAPLGPPEPTPSGGGAFSFQEGQLEKDPDAREQVQFWEEYFLPSSSCYIDAKHPVPEFQTFLIVSGTTSWLVFKSKIRLWLNRTDPALRRSSKLLSGAQQSKVMIGHLHVPTITLVKLEFG